MQNRGSGVGPYSYSGRFAVKAGMAVMKKHRDRAAAERSADVCAHSGVPMIAVNEGEGTGLGRVIASGGALDANSMEPAGILCPLVTNVYGVNITRRLG